MKFYDVDLAVVINAIKKRFYIVLIFTVVFAIFGGFVASVYLATANKDTKINFEKISLASLEEIEYTKNYYIDILNEQQKLTDQIGVYISTISKIVKNQDFLKKLQEMSDQHNTISDAVNRSVDLIEIKLFVPLDFRETVIEEMELSIQIIEKKLAYAEDTRTVAESLENQKGIDQTKMKKMYEEIMEIPIYKSEIQQYSLFLKTAYDQQSMIANIAQVEAAINEYSIKLKELTDNMNNIMDEICQEEALIISSKILNEEFTVDIQHTYKKPNDREDFLAIVTFFSIIGLVLGCFIMIVQQIKKEKINKK